jgi:DNA processing protein
MCDLPSEAWAVALASLPMMGPARLLAVLRRWSARDAWVAIGTGVALDDPSIAATCAGIHVAEKLRATWRSAVARTDVVARWERHRVLGVGVALVDDVTYPAVLASDPEPPAVLFRQGDIAAIVGPSVAIVGTRRCTAYGRDVAYGLGCELSAAGVHVVSGLALGIDAAAHAGALAAGEGAAAPIGVVGSGLDVVYPARHGALWRRVRDAGVLLSEAPLGSPPERWRFPARNRLIAALADAVVVVESHETGGSMHTVAEAARRDRTVLAVPGPVRSPASAGTNRLLGDGAVPACDVDDVLLAIGLDAARATARRGSPHDDAIPGLDEPARSVLDALGWQPATIEHLAAATRLSLVDLACALAELEQRGVVGRTDGWYERSNAAVR